MASDPRLTCAIGDIHGRHDLLVRLLAVVAEYTVDVEHRFVFLGDYIDRGPDSAAVIEAIRALQARAPNSVTCLMGNHESMLLTVLAQPEAFSWWIANGGGSTLDSFEVEDPRDIPDDVIAWLSSLPTVHEDSRRFYVHAGLRPGVLLSDQSERDRLWIREPFLETDWDFGKYVVHGHTPVRTGTPDVRRHRVNLDTGAVFGGALTAGLFGPDQDGAFEFLRVRAGLV